MPDDNQSIAVAGSVILYLFLNSIVCVLSTHLYPTDFGSRYGIDGPPPVPGLPGCYLADGSTIIFFDFFMLLLFELGRSLTLGNHRKYDANASGTAIVILTLWRCFKSRE